jgi:hypothetical protein
LLQDSPKANGDNVVHIGIILARRQKILLPVDRYFVLIQFTILVLGHVKPLIEGRLQT